MYILIDDERNVVDVDIICRTAKAGIEVLDRFQGMFDVLIIDHDLGEPNGLTGYDVIKYAVENKLLPDEVQIISSNPVGVKNIGETLKANGFIAEPNGRIFKRY